MLIENLNDLNRALFKKGQLLWKDFVGVLSPDEITELKQLNEALEAHKNKGFVPLMTELEKKSRELKKKGMSLIDIVKKLGD